MNENEINNYPVENNRVPTEEVNLELNENKGPKEGFSFNWIAFALGVAFWYWWCEGNVDWIFYIYLAFVVLIHELGHVIMGTSFGCRIKLMQVFFIPFLTYMPKQVPKGGWWRNIVWSLGILPLGGITMFTTQGMAISEINLRGNVCSSRQLGYYSILPHFSFCMLLCDSCQEAAMIY